MRIVGRPGAEKAQEHLDVERVRLRVLQLGRDVRQVHLGPLLQPRRRRLGHLEAHGLAPEAGAQRGLDRQGLGARAHARRAAIPDARELELVVVDAAAAEHAHAAQGRAHGGPNVTRRAMARPPSGGRALTWAGRRRGRGWGWPRLRRGLRPLRAAWAIAVVAVVERRRRRRILRDALDEQRDVLLGRAPQHGGHDEDARDRQQ